MPVPGGPGASDGNGGRFAKLIAAKAQLRLEREQARRNKAYLAQRSRQARARDKAHAYAKQKAAKEKEEGYWWNVDLGNGWAWRMDGEIFTQGLKTHGTYFLEVADGILTVHTGVGAARVLAAKLLFRRAAKEAGRRAAKDALNTAQRAVKGSADDVLKNPELLRGHTRETAKSLCDDAVRNGWEAGPTLHGRNAGKGTVLRKMTEDGKSTGDLIQWHPGGGRHGPSPYFKVSSGERGTTRVYQHHIRGK